ncbi:hypothetical protein LTR85_001909 [Meristemomyces frigidus]|nr:hypothetical protein LTR85_001909 [Meristemomyces frigidus]
MVPSWKRKANGCAGGSGIDGRHVAGYGEPPISTPKRRQLSAPVIGQHSFFLRQGGNKSPARSAEGNRSASSSPSTFVGGVCSIDYAAVWEWLDATTDEDTMLDPNTAAEEDGDGNGPPGQAGPHATTLTMPDPESAIEWAALLPGARSRSALLRLYHARYGSAASGEQ